MIYYIVFLFYFILFFIELNYNLERKTRLALYASSIIVFVLFFGLRWKTGTDWPTYYSYFHDNFTISEFYDTQFETGYVYLNYLIKILSRNYSVFLLIFTSLIGIAFFIGNKDLIKFPQAGILYLFCTVGTPIRQTLAAAIILISYKYIISRNFIRFFCLVILAACFHRSAFIFLPFYFITKINFSNKNLIIIYTLSIIIGSFGFINEFVFDFIGNYIIGIDETVSGKLGTILTNDTFDREASFISKVLSFVNSLFYILLFIHFSKKESDGIFKLFFVLFIFGLVISRLFTGPLSEFARFGNYFSFVLYILVAFSLESIFGWKRNVLAVFFVAFCFFKLNESHNQYKDLYLPYISIFETVERSVY